MKTMKAIIDKVNITEAPDDTESKASQMSDWMERNTRWRVRRQKYGTVVEKPTGPGGLDIEPNGKDWIVTITTQHNIKGGVDQAAKETIALGKQAGLKL